MKQNIKQPKNLNIGEIRKFFGFDSEKSNLLKLIKVPPVIKLELLEGFRKSLCQLPSEVGKKVVGELSKRR